MKKLFLILALVLSVASMQAQIKREAYGIALGASRDDVMAVLQAKDLYVNEEPIPYGELLWVYGDIYFAGIAWQSIAVMISDGKVSSIVFNYQSYDLDAATTVSANLLNQLSNKYGKYMEKAPETSETFTTAKFEASYSDRTTGISVDGELLLIGTSTMMLMYYDATEVNKLQQQVYDEL